MKKLLLVLLLLVGSSAYADNLTFTGTTTNGEYGPYSMLLNGTSTQMICFSSNNWISAGETWYATGYNITQIGAAPSPFNVVNTTNPVIPSLQGLTLVQAYDVLGYLADALFANPGTGQTQTDLQLAIWSVIGKGLNSDFTPTAGSNSDVQNAVNYVLNTPSYKTSDVFYFPVVGPNGQPIPQVLGTNPQPFILHVPEPSSLVLLGAGLLGLVGLSLKKVTA